MKPSQSSGKTAAKPVRSAARKSVRKAVPARQNEKRPAEREGARTVGRVLAALELLAGERMPLRLTDIARALKLPPSSAHALLQQLVKYEYAQVVGAERRYEGGANLSLLGSRVLSGLELIRVGRPVLEELSKTLGENVYLGMRHSRGMAYVDCVEGSYGLMMRFPMGAPRPLHASGPGKLYLAFFVAPSALDEVLGSEPLAAYTPHTVTKRSELRRQLDEIRVTGYAANEQEVVPDAFGISAPIFGANSEFVGCVTCGIPGIRFPQIKKLAIKKVMEAAAEITRRMGNDGWSRVIQKYRETARASAPVP